MGLTRQGKGSELMLAVNNRGAPIGALVSSPQQGEIKLADLTLATVRVPRARGRIRIRPKVKSTESG